MNDLENWQAMIREFVEARGWHHHQNPKSLAAAMAVEAGEVLEHFLWVSDADSFSLPDDKRREVAHELSDVLMGVLRVADLLQIDLRAAFAEKMEINRRKYPPEKVRGRAIKYTDL